MPEDDCRSNDTVNTTNDANKSRERAQRSTSEGFGLHATHKS